MLKSSIYKQEQLDNPLFQRWCPQLREPVRYHRKTWEFCYIAEALSERGLIAPGKRGLGFGVGKEPLAAMFATYGCEIVGTDLDPERAAQSGWVETQQHSSTLAGLNERGICDDETFRRLVSFRTVDMNVIPDDLRGFDFTYSSCSFEHLGSIERGMRFIERQMDCLKPGGVAVHTTEFNVSSDEETIDNNSFLVLFRRRDILEMARRLSDEGHEIELDLSMGTLVADNYVDLPPYSGEYCLKIEWDRFVTTSVGLIVRKSSENAARKLARRARRFFFPKAA